VIALTQSHFEEALLSKKERVGKNFSDRLSHALNRPEKWPLGVSYAQDENQSGCGEAL
jgi:hypothetical protein